jgi:hypothetical protein
VTVRIVSPADFARVEGPALGFSEHPDRAIVRPAKAVRPGVLVAAVGLGERPGLEYEARAYVETLLAAALGEEGKRAEGVSAIELRSR